MLTPKLARAGTNTANNSAQMGLRWLCRLRWIAAVGQAAVLATMPWMTTAVPPLAFAIPAAVAASNLAVPRTWDPHRSTGWILVLDTILLSGLLALTGAVLNPFTVLYLVQIVLSALLLTPRWTWAITGLSVAGFASLFAIAPPQNPHAQHLGATTDAGMGAHLAGMWWAFLLTALLIATFVVELRKALSRHETEVARLREAAARAERLNAVSALAAGAAHELATPLASVAFAADEIERLCTGLSAGPGVLLETAAIREDLAACRTILDEMALGAGAIPGEALRDVTVGSIVAAALAGLNPQERTALAVQGPTELVVRGPAVALARVVRSLLRNALEAGVQHTPCEPPTLTLEPLPGGVVEIRVEDRGEGLSAEAQARWSEPFFSTRGPQRGLGLFVAFSLANALGGELDLANRAGGGATARLRLPLSANLDQ
jgi:two-component system sensor histidine kinase RegB